MPNGTAREFEQISNSKVPVPGSVGNQFQAEGLAAATKTVQEAHQAVTGLLAGPPIGNVSAAGELATVINGGTGADLAIGDVAKTVLEQGESHLHGATEWVVKDEQLAKESLENGISEYTTETGLRPDLQRTRPAGVTQDAGFDPETKQIFVYNDVKPEFKDGFLMEELEHYRQVKEAGLLGTPLQEIEKANPGFSAKMENEVIDRVKQSGFIPYDYRNYAPGQNPILDKP